jgi:hypothetical protein
MRSKVDILAECVDALLVGQEPNDILEHYPEAIEELSPLMNTVRKVRATSNNFEVLMRPETSVATSSRTRSTRKTPKSDVSRRRRAAK